MLSVFRHVGRNTISDLFGRPRPSWLPICAKPARRAVNDSLIQPSRLPAGAAPLLHHAEGGQEATASRPSDVMRCTIAAHGGNRPAYRMPAPNRANMRKPW